MLKEYMLVQDDSCHWYIISSNKIKDWDKWLDDEDNWEIPKWAKRIDGPHSIVFQNWKEI